MNGRRADVPLETMKKKKVSIETTNKMVLGMIFGINKKHLKQKRVANAPPPPSSKVWRIKIHRHSDSKTNSATPVQDWRNLDSRSRGEYHTIYFSLGYTKQHRSQNGVLL